MPIMKKQKTTPLFIYDNCEVNYSIMYRDNDKENYHVKVFIYEWNDECKEWYKVLNSHEFFLTFEEAWTYYKLLIKTYLI